MNGMAAWPASEADPAYGDRVIVKRSISSAAVVLATVVAVTAVAAPATAAPLDGVESYLTTREGTVQVAVYDNLTGKTSLYTEGAAKQYTASIQKVDILAGWLRSFQDDGTAIPSAVPYSLQYLMTQMIEASDNVAATSLFYFGGGCSAFQTFNKMIPMKNTKVGCETPTYYGWGNTLTTAADQVALMKVFAYGTYAKKPAKSKSKGKGKPKPILRKAARNYGLDLMTNIQPSQSWGITCGPWGATCDAPNYAPPDPTVTVAHKNGWKTIPTCTQPIPQCPWQVNSVGWVKGQDRDYVVSVLTTNDPVGTGDTYGFTYGIDTIQEISKLVWANLA